MECVAIEVWPINGMQTGAPCLSFFIQGESVREGDFWNFQGCK